MARWIALALCGLGLLACTPSEESQAATRAELQAAIEAYLPLLAQAYADGDTSRLEGLAVPKEIAKVDHAVRELASQGSHLAPVFHQLTIEDVDVFNASNAYVTTVEVWDIRQLTLGGDQLIAEDVGKSQRVLYQLNREGGRWRILFRSIKE